MKHFKYLFFLGFVLLWGCQSPEKPFIIYCIGDSTMADKVPEVYPETGWCQALPEFFNSSVKIKNHAVNGRSSKSFIDEGRWQTVLDSLNPGDYVFIQFGHNDEKDYDTTRFTTPYGSYSKNLERFVNETHEKRAIPVLFTSIVRRKFGDNGILVDTHGDYPEATRHVAAKFNVSLIDLQKLTETWVNGLGDEPSKSMYLWTEPTEKFPEGRKDDTHLSEKGAKEIAHLAMSEAIKQNIVFSKRLIVSVK